MSFRAQVLHMKHELSHRKNLPGGIELKEKDRTTARAA